MAPRLWLALNPIHASHIVVRRVSTGANNTFVAPVDIGDGASTGAGTVVRRDVPPGALAVSTGPQRHVERWVQRKRPGSPSAQAADAANTSTAPPAASAAVEETSQ